MQYDMGRFDQPLVDETQPKAHVWTDIGEAEVEHSIFGRAKVRVYRQKDEVRGASRWTLATVSLVVGAVWLVSDVSRQPEIVHVAPPKPVAELSEPEAQKPQRVAPAVKPRTQPPVAARSPVPQMQAASAVVAARPLLRAPVVVSAVSAPVATAPAAVAAKPAAISVVVPVKPLAPTTIPSEVLSVPVAPASPVNTGN
jgi:hypothetical protein